MKIKIYSSALLEIHKDDLNLGDKVVHQVI